MSKNKSRKAVVKAPAIQPPAKVERQPTKTPMYSAINASRYQRQGLIKDINTAEGTHLICYVSNLEAEIDRNDIISFNELLHNITENSPIDLLLNTGGGDVDACEKLVRLVLSRVGEQPFRVIVPDLAKSAGTLVALAANTIIMSDTSELGMIDPQFLMKDARSNEFMYSVISYLEAYEEHAAALRRNPTDPVTLLMMDGFDAKTVRKFQRIRDRVRTFAEDMLKRHGAPPSSISAALMDSATWRTHGQPIRHEDAKQIELPVEYLPPSHKRWERYWSLYCMQRHCLESLEAEGAKKIFESQHASQIV